MSKRLLLTLVLGMGLGLTQACGHDAKKSAPASASGTSGTDGSGGNLLTSGSSATNGGVGFADEAGGGGGGAASIGIGTASGGDGGTGQTDALGAAGAAGAPMEVFATNPFVVAEHDPLSSFAADVDTASYDSFRRDALRGSVPDASRVRLEEFVNYFDYDYPAPEADAELPFEIALDAAPSPFGTGTTLLRVGIQGKQPPPLERKPTNLVFLVDVSGSMQSEEKLPLVQHVLSETVGVLNSEDTISIVTYASGTDVRLPPTPVSESEAIIEVIDGLSAGGSTAGAAGIDLAYEQAEAGFIEDGLNHVILCTDGDFNVGPSSTDALVELIEEKRRTGVTLTVLGFGAGNNDELMEGISNAGNGVYGNITDTEQATRYVEERMLATLEQIAKDVKLQVEFNREQVHAYRLLGYENRAIADDDFRDDTVDAGEIGSGHRVTAIYELVVAGASIPDASGAPLTDDGAAYDGAVEVADEDWVLVKIRYKEPGASEADPAFEVSRSLGADNLLSALNSADDDFRWAVAVAGVAELLKDSPYAPRDHVATIAELVNDSVYSDDPDKVEFADLFANIRQELE